MKVKDKIRHKFIDWYRNGEKMKQKIENESENKTFPHTHFNIGIENIWKCTPRKWKWKKTCPRTHWNIVIEKIEQTYKQVVPKNHDSNHDRSNRGSLYKISACREGFTLWSENLSSHATCSCHQHPLQCKSTLKLLIFISIRNFFGIACRKWKWK